MGATNTTTHYELSQFIATDKPAWLQDYNGDMGKIDAAIDEAKVAADTAQTTASSAASASTQNASDIVALQTDVSGQGSNITSLQSNVNTINSLIGNGTPTTTDQTLIGAINEINANTKWKQLGSITAGDSVTLPGTYQEILILIMPYYAVTTKLITTFNVPKLRIDLAEQLAFRGGVDDNNYAQAMLNNNVFTLTNVGSASGACVIYYR